MILLMLLLQHIMDKPAAVAIAQDSGSSGLLQTLLLPIVGALAGFLFKSLVTKPAERAEQYEEAKYRALENSLTEFKTTNQSNLREWQQWREHQSERTTKLELQVDNINKQFNEKIMRLESEVSETKEITQDIRESLAGLRAQLSETIGKWTK